jgi:hypothetical protein
MKARTARNKFMLPLLAGGVVLLFIISPSVAAILQIISFVNPVIWGIGALIAIWAWRRYVG